MFLHLARIYLLSGQRTQAIYFVRTESQRFILMKDLGIPKVEAGVRWQPKVVFDKALFPDTDSYGSGFLKLRWRFDNEPQAYLAFHEIELEASSFDADDSTGTVQELTFGGKTYICKQFAGSLSGNRAILDNAATNRFSTRNTNHSRAIRRRYE